MSAGTIDIPCFFNRDFSDPHLGTVMWQVARGATNLLQIMNTTGEQRHYQLKVRDARGVLHDRQGLIGPRGTIALSAEALVGSVQPDEILAVDLGWDGEPGGLVGGALWESAEGGGFLPLEQTAERTSPDLTMSGLYGVSDEVRTAGGESSWRHPLILYNSSDSVRPLKIELQIKEREAPVQFSEREIQLDPFRGRLVDLVQDLGEVSHADWVSLDLKWEGPADALRAYSFSLDPGEGRVARNPLVNAGAKRPKVSNYPWYANDELATRVYIKNPTRQARRFVGHLFLEEGGEYDLGVMEIPARQVRVVDLGKIKAEQIPDADGRTISDDVEKGQFLWFPWKSPYLLVGRAVVSGRDSGEAISLSCPAPNCHIDDPRSLALIPVSIDAIVNSSQQMTAKLQYFDCGTGEFSFECDVTNLSTYGSSDTAVATVNQTGLVSALTPGNVTIMASLETERVLCNLFTCTAEPFPVTLQRGVPMLSRPKILSIAGPNNVPLAAGSGGVNAVKLTANVDPPSSSTSSFSWSVASGSDRIGVTAASSQMIQVLATGASTSRGDAAVQLIYTVNGVPSLPKLHLLTVQKPSKIVKVGQTAVSAMNCAAGSAGPLTRVTWEVHDQFQSNSQAIAFPGLPVTDKNGLQIPPNNSCNISMPATGSFTTNSSGRWPDYYFICSSVCGSGSSCTVTITQVFTINGFQLTSDPIQITYTCSGITFNK